MAIPTLPFVLGVLALAYLCSFILFAILRIVTGVSIQRIGFTSLRRIAYTSKEGVKIEIRGLGLQVHRPTFAQPTWVSIVIQEPRVTLDLNSIGSSKGNLATENAKVYGLASTETDKELPEQTGGTDGEAKDDQRRTWANLIRVKDQIKKLHSSLSWIRLVDVVALRGSVHLDNVGEVHVGSFVVSVDTRPTTVDRSRLFQHTKSASDDHKPAEWTIATRSILFTPINQGAIEILDHCTLNIHGFLHNDIEGLRDATISLKLGRLSIPYDDIMASVQLAREARRRSVDGTYTREERETSTDLVSPVEKDAREEIFQGSSEAKEFIKSTIRGIREISFAVGFVGISKRVDFVRPKGKPIYLNASMKEVGLDMYRMDQTSPSHATYFPYTDIAHQALLSAISISVGIDDGHAHPERLAHLPMMTATVRTTLPAKLLQFSLQKDYEDHNANMLFATVVVTSPSVDLDPRHLPVVLATIENRPRTQASSLQRRGHYLIAQLLPKTSIKLSVHEPVFRVSLPPVGTRQASEFEFDLLISAISSVSLDIDSSHVHDDLKQYSITSAFRLTSHRLYYQTTARHTHDLILTESMEVKTQIYSANEVHTALDIGVNKSSVFHDSARN